MKTVIFLMAMLASTATQAGLFLDLDIGARLLDCEADTICDEYEEQHNPIGIVRLGYRYKVVHAYWGYEGSLTEENSMGSSLLMIGLHFEMGD